MANSQTVHGVLGFLMSSISIRQNVVWAGELPRMRELDSNFESLQLQDSIRSMTGVFGRCDCFQVCLRIQRMRLQCRKRVLKNSIPL